MPDVLWELLGLDPTDDRDAIDRAYRQSCLLPHHQGKASEALRFAWKLLRDPFYRGIHAVHPEESWVREAGFFDDGLDTELDQSGCQDPCWLTTPYHKILSRLHRLDDFDPAQLAAYPPLVLLCTGSFSPIHNGHLDMMELAKNEMIQKGHLVLGGYLSPSHDSYVTAKLKDAALLLDEHRIRLCHEAVALNEWIMVDTWEARYVPGAVNFTDVILRLERYLNHHFKPAVPLRVCYVFGGDNAAFARTFLLSGHAVCVERPGYEDRVEAIKTEVASAGDRIVFAHPRLEYLNISSSLIRSEEMVAMPERSSRYYRLLKENVTHAADPIPRRRYIVREESAWAVAPWRQGRDEGMLSEAKDRFLNQLLLALKGACARPPLPDRALDLEITLAKLEKQIAHANDLQKQAHTINLDDCTEGTHRLGISRLFGLADGQCFSTQVIPRPGFPAIMEQVQSIPGGNYVLIDDDIASGQTMRMIISVFPDDIAISKVQSLLEQTRSVETLRVDQIDYLDFYDAVDFRDFLFGARSGGLVVRLPDGEIARVPYLAPYVTLSTRARLPASQEVAFSLAMWRANESFFAALDRPVLARESDPATQKLLQVLGFEAATPLLEIVKWHRERLEQSTSRKTEQRETPGRENEPNLPSGMTLEKSVP